MENFYCLALICITFTDRCNRRIQVCLKILYTRLILCHGEYSLNQSLLRVLELAILKLPRLFLAVSLYNKVIKTFLF